MARSANAITRSPGSLATSAIAGAPTWPAHIAESPGTGRAARRAAAVSGPSHASHGLGDDFLSHTHTGGGVPRTMLRSRVIQPESTRGGKRFTAMRVTSARTAALHRVVGSALTAISQP